MVHDSHGMHHFHIRKRIHQKHEPYPHPDKFKRVMDKLIYLVAILGPILTLPQVAKVWLDQTTAGISLITWSAYSFSAFFWVVYGILHKEKPIIFTNCLWLAMDISIVLGILLL